MNETEKSADSYEKMKKKEKKRKKRNGDVARPVIFFINFLLTSLAKLRHTSFDWNDKQLSEE